MPLLTPPEIKPLDTQWSAVSTVASQPLWSRAVREQLEGFTQLPVDWDSYGSEPVKREVLTEALDILANVSRFNMNKPHVLAVPGGGVQFEWANASSELEIEVRPDGTVEFLIVDMSNEMLEGPVNQSYDSRELFCLSDWFLSEKKSVHELFRMHAPTY